SDDEGVPRASGDRLDAIRPGRELVGGVEIVVALVLGKVGVVAEPRVAATAMKTNVADGRGDFIGGLQRAANNWLIDAAESRLELAEDRKYFRIVPRCVTHFDSKGIIGETFQSLF